MDAQAVPIAMRRQNHKYGNGKACGEGSRKGLSLVRPFRCRAAQHDEQAKGGQR